MPISIVRPLILSATLGLAAVCLPAPVNAASAGSIERSTATLESHFSPRPSKATRIDFDAWDFMLSETVLYMGPSTRTPARQKQPQIGTRLPTGNRSRLKMEGNKVLYPLLKKSVESEMKAYADELITLGSRLDIPSLPKNEQLAYWINLHNAVLITTIMENYPGPKRQPGLIEPLESSDTKLHDAKFIKIDGYALSLRDIREKIVFPNWKNKDIPYAFHLGHLSSPSLANYAYSGPTLRKQLARNAYEFVNSLRAYEKGTLNAYVSDVSPWYYPGMDSELDSYFRKRMRPEVYAEYQANGIKRADKQDLTIADVTGGHGKQRLFANVQTDSYSRLEFGADIDDYLHARRDKLIRLRGTEWFKNGTVTIEDTPTEDEPANIE